MTNKQPMPASRGLSLVPVDERYGLGGRGIGIFFSSRRRHTRFDCDWSSDVCSSDLAVSGPSEEDGTLAAVSPQELYGLLRQVHIPLAARQFGGGYKALVAPREFPLRQDRKSVV